MRLVLNLAVYLMIYAVLALEAQAALGLDRESYGVWDRAGDNPVSEYPFTIGQEYGEDWANINTARSNFNWTALDARLDFAYQQNQKFFVKIQPVAGIAKTAPPWMFGTSPNPAILDGWVPSLTESGTGASPFTYGYYLDADFKLYFAEMVQDLADHVRNEVPAHLQELIGFVRVDTGTTGDEEPYENGGLVPAQYQISAQDWEDYRLWVFELYRAAFQDGPGPVIPLLFQNIEVSKFPVEWDWVTNNVTGGFGAKYAGLVRGHHLTSSQSVTDDFKPYAMDTDFAFFSRNEMDQTWTKPFFQLNIRLNMYWCAVEQLHPGLSVWDVSQSCLDNTYIDDYTFAFTFFNKWAAELDPPTARGGFCIFHEGFDSADTVKFPVDPYGSASKLNQARYVAICASNSANGAQMDAPAFATLGQVAQRSDLNPGFNDSGWEIVPGNYERFINQIDPDNTSKSLFRINGPLTSASHPYDRFARGFDSATGKNTMYFDLHDNLLPNPGQRLQLSVIYFDKGTGQFELQYDAVGNSQKMAFVVTKGNSNTWKTNTVVVTDWVCANNGPNGADLMLQNVDSDDDIFHLLEVVKLAYVNIGTVGQGSVSARNDFTTWSPVSTTVSEGLRMELTPSPALGWKFSHWSGDLSGTNARPFLFPTEDTRVTATFVNTGLTVVEDDFESGNLTGGTGWSGGWSTSGTATPTVYNGGYTILLQSSGIMTRTIATPLANATLSFDWDIDHLEAGEFGVVEVSTDGTVWHQIWSKDMNDNGTDVQNAPDLLTTATIDVSGYGTISHIRFKAIMGTGDRFWVDNVSLSGFGGGPVSNAPVFMADPISKAGATEDAAYTGQTLSGSATDADSDPLAYSAVAGPSWLSVAPNGALSGTPSASDFGLNSWIVEVDDSVDGTDEAILLIDVVAADAGSSYSVWSNQYGLTEGPEGNDDDDALNNLYEFGLGGNPTNPADLGYLPTFGSASGGGSNWLEYIHVRQTDPNSGLLYYLELTDNLVSNVWTTNGYTVVGSGPFTNGFDAVTNRIETDSNEQFIRLIIEEN